MKITYADTTCLIDPMLAKKGTYPGFEGTYRSYLRNPLVELPMPAEAVFGDVDAIIVTHTHLDHWDDAAQALLPKDIPLFTQHETDAELIRSQRFTDVRIPADTAEFGGVTLSRTGGQHGTDEMFANTLRLVEDCGLTFLHVFPYSIRPGTPAAKMPQVDGAVIKHRAAQLRQAGARALAQHLDQFVGRTCTVLMEKPDFGRLDNFTSVLLNGSTGISGDLTQTHITGHDGSQLLGTLAR